MSWPVFVVTWICGAMTGFGIGVWYAVNWRRK